MLVITRKTDESLIINDNIEITILEIGKDRIKVGINAPKEISIARKEIYVTENENRQASEALPADVLKLLLKNNGKENE